MTPVETRLWQVVAQHGGREQVIGMPALAAQSGMSERQVQKVIKRLIEVYGCPIASSPQPPAGYYIPETLFERQAALDSLKGRALSILYRMSRLRRATLKETIDQLLLGIEEDAAERHHPGLATREEWLSLEPLGWAVNQALEATDETA